MKQLLGWQQNGQRIETPAGINVEDYFRDGSYLGPDEDGIEPIFAEIASSDRE